MNDIVGKTDRYESMLAEALATADVAPPAESPLGNAAIQYEEMARSYLADGRHFRETDQLGDALAAFAYGHGWLDAGARIGLLEVPEESHLFTV